MWPPWLDQTRSTQLFSVVFKCILTSLLIALTVLYCICVRGMQVRLFQSSKCFLEELEVDLGKTTKCSHSYYFSPTPKNSIVLLSARISWRIEIHQDKVLEILRHLLYLPFLFFFTCHFLKAIYAIWFCEAVATSLLLFLYINMSKCAFVVTYNCLYLHGIKMNHMMFVKNIKQVI